MSSKLLETAKNCKYPVLFVGYMYLIHWGWQKMQYSPVVNEGKEPIVLFSGKFARAIGLAQQEEKDEKKS